MANSASPITIVHEGSPPKDGPMAFGSSVRSVESGIPKESGDIEASLPSEQLGNQGFGIRSLFTRTRHFFDGLLFHNPTQTRAKDEIKAQYLKWTENFASEDYKKVPRGWPQLAAFLDSCDSFSMYRRFGTSHSRLLVDYQVDITSIEQKLRHLDQCDLESDGDDKDTSYRLGYRNQVQESDSIKIELMAQLENKLRVYDDLLLRQHQLKLLPQSSEADHASVSKWIWLERPLCDCEGQYDFIFRHKDFVSLGRQSHNRFEDAVKSIFSLWLGSWFKKYIGIESLNDPNDKSVQYYSADRVTIFARGCIVFFAVVILFVPVVLFLLVSLDQVSMAIIILTFVFAFSIVISLLPEARVMDIFFGSATYCAVLVTFLGNLQGAAD